MKSLLLIGALFTNIAIAMPAKQITNKDVVEPRHPKKLAGQNKDDVACLAYSVFREAGVLSATQQFAVAQVHINRVREGSWGKHLCQVVFAKKQFSWTDEKVVRWTEREQFWYMTLAQNFVDGEIAVKKIESTKTKKVLHYYANYVKPKWRNSGVVVAMAGPHVFLANVAH